MENGNFMMKQINETIEFRLWSLANTIYAATAKGELSLRESEAVKKVLGEFSVLVGEYLDWYGAFKKAKEKEPYLSFEDFRLQNNRIDELMAQINELTEEVFYEG